MPDPNAKRILWYVFAGSKGGNNRIKIVDLLKERPYNINQLAEAIKLIIRQFNIIFLYLRRII